VLQDEKIFEKIKMMEKPHLTRNLLQLGDPPTAHKIKNLGTNSEVLAERVVRKLNVGSPALIDLKMGEFNPPDKL
jgi:hypothetical protein